MSYRSRLVYGVVAGLVSLVCLVNPAVAQQAPLGAHHAGPGSAAGSGSVSPTGGFGAAIPLDVPTARGQVPVPLALAYTGSPRVGEGGVGWSVPFSYVTRTSSFAGSRPSDTVQYGQPRLRDQVTVVLGGRSIPMIETESGRYRPMVDGQIMELVDNGSGWTLHDGTGYVYTFEALGGHPAAGLWYLRFINDRTHVNPVELRYEVAHSAPGATEVLLTEITYNRHPTQHCYKNAIHLVYQADPTSSARPVLGYRVEGGTLAARTAVLHRIDVMARGMGCGTSLHRLRRYELTYEPDADTGLPRLVAADLLGREGTPEASERIPVGRFDYGAATSNGALVYDANATPLTRDPGMAGEIGRTDVEFGKTYKTRKGFLDMTGDGRPDWVHGTAGSALQIARSTASGTVGSPQLTFNGSAPLFPGSTGVPELARTHAASSHHYGYNSKTHWSQTSIQAIDFNADGRTDLLQVASDDTWRLWLNTPGPNNDPATIVWHEVSLDVSGPAAELQQRGLLHDEALVLARSVTGNEIDARTCWIDADPDNGISDTWSRCTQEEAGGFLTVEVPYWRQRTFVEWRLQDVNGDGYPDLVSNSRPYEARKLAESSSDCDEDGRPLFADFGWCTDRYRVGPAPGNELLVFYNKAGATFIQGQSPFSEPVVLSNDGAAVEEWSSYAQSLVPDVYVVIEGTEPSFELEVPNNSPSFMRAGLLDVNGDGIADRLPGLYQNGDPLARLGTGEGFAGTVHLPGSPERGNDRVSVCDDDAPPETTVSTWWSRSLVDLTGDGIPDYVEREPGTWKFQVYTGTGAGWSESPTPIVVTGGAFNLSRGNEQCGDPATPPSTMPMLTTEGLLDLDGDGKPDLVAASDSGLSMWSLRGSSGVLGARDAGRLVQGGTGYGSYQRITYVSAKDDHSTAHQVPVPEIVVDRVTTVMESADGSTEELAPTRYAYGGAQRRWDPVRDRFAFLGYRRTVVARGAENYGILRGLASITERQSVAGAGYDSLVSDGRVSKTYTLDGIFLSDAWSLLSANLGNDPRWHGGTTIAHAVGSVEYLDPLQPNDPDCTEVDPYVVTSIGLPDNDTWDQACRIRGYVYPKTVDSWTGSSSPTLGSDQNIATRRTIQSIDDFGRPTYIVHQNDVHYGPDDICEEIGYADAADGRMLAATHFRRLYRCGGSGRSGRLAGERYLYDGSTQEGVVDEGFVTRRIVERYDVDSGAKLDELTVDDTSWGPGGVLLSVSNTTVTTDPLTDAATSISNLEEYLDFDPFVIAPQRLSVTSNDGTTISRHYHLDAHTLAPTGMTDPNGTTSKSYLDGFFRPIADTVTTSAGEHVVSANEYAGFTVGGGARMIHNWSFHEEVPAPQLLGAASIADAVPADSAIRLTVHLDSLGRSTYQEQHRGSDFPEPLIIGDTDYDTLGRPQFTADPYVASTTGPHYGTSVLYRTDGSVQCQIHGRGYQTASSTSTSEARFATCTDRVFDNHAVELRAQGPNELDPASPHHGGYESAISTAIGWTLERSRWEGSRVEASRYTYDPLGNLRTMVRYQDPGSLTNPVTWTTSYDSLGQVRRLQEPGVATRSFSYDGWGNQVETRWTGSGGAQHAIQSQYDGFGRLVRSAEKKNGQLLADSHLELFYDVSAGPDHQPARNLTGRLSHAFSPSMEVFFSYDELGRTESQIYRNDEGITHAQDLVYGFGGQLDSLTFRYPSGGQAPETAHYFHDSAANLERITWTDEHGQEDLFERLEVDAFGRYLHARYGNGVEEQWLYNPGDRRELTQYRVEATEGVRYTGLGNYDGEMRLGRRIELSTIGGFKYETTDYEYDAAYRLARYRTSSYGSTVREERYSYDGLGNLRDRYDVTGSVKRFFNPSTTDPDRLCTYAEILILHPAPLDTASTSSLVLDPKPISGSCHYRYDPLGNVNRIGLPGETTRTFQYDGQSRVTRISGGGAVATYRYGPLGDVTHLDVTGAAAEDTRQDRRFGPLVEESIFAVDSTSTRVVERRIPGPFGLMMIRRGFGPATETLYAHGDDLTGHVRTDATGAVVQTTELDPFGATLADTGQPGTDTYTKYLFNGGDTLGAFDVTHIGARLYDPRSGRFLQRDPLYIPRTASTTHPYAFAWNDPINFADPTGLDPSTCMGDECDYLLSFGTAAGILGIAAGSLYDYYFGGSSPESRMDAPGAIIVEAPDPFTVDADGYAYLERDGKYFMATPDGPLREVSELAYFSRLSIRDRIARTDPKRLAYANYLNNFTTKAVTYYLIGGTAIVGAAYAGPIIYQGSLRAGVWVHTRWPWAIPAGHVTGAALSEQPAYTGSVRGGAAALGGADDVLRQLTPNSCGPTCGAMLLGDRGIGAFRSQVASGSGVLTSAGSLARGLNAVDDAGRWSGSGVARSSFNALNQTGSWAAMLWTRGSRTGHWVVVDGVRAGKVMLRDPAAGRRVMSIDEFMEVWNGYAVWRK